MTPNASGEAYADECQILELSIFNDAPKENQSTKFRPYAIEADKSFEL